MVKDMIVHLDGSERDDIALAHGEALAAQFEARLVGLYTNVFQTRFMPADLGGGTSADIIADILDQARRAGDDTEHRLRQRFELLRSDCELRRVDGSEGDLVQAVAHYARCHDIMIMLRPYGEDRPRWVQLTEAALFAGGRSVYLVPPAMPAPSRLDTVVVAWRDTFESTRAIAEAMPFLKRAASVILAAVEDPEEEGEDAAEGLLEMARHLERHGVQITVRRLPRRGKISEMLLNECQRAAADLLVMGAYGHTRFREWILGGTTRSILSQASLPVLMAH
ncbi:universal stress protein [Consotaella salsifontis]|uniref:Nucleotide-binding universal stress protein, UspA family n=1 Tax=Consotaella salsifontis TaxID=1365950 RepID=A0A1T4T862_9HYPH|nr:universal stress protein [Consotaella salsifontis]SKA36338.1 Nucleotide-binding universal stress protein, UspA family [Consotaella salsifontis]